MLPRKLSILDTKRLVDHLISLRGEDRRLRFGGVVTDDYIESYVTKSLHSSKDKWFGVDHIDGRIVAACHVALLEKSAELGCSVDNEFRGNGLAQTMFDRAITWLRAKGIQHVFMHCLSENAIMRHIANKNDMSVVSYQGESDAEVNLEPPNAFTPMVDAYADRMSMYDMVFKNNLRVMCNMFEVASHT